VEPVGILFVNAIRMTVVPLVVAMLLTGILSISDARVAVAAGSPEPGAGRRAHQHGGGVRHGCVRAPVLADTDRSRGVGRLQRIRDGRPGGARGPAAPGLTQWLTELIPVNPLKSAADGAMLPLLVFTILLGYGAHQALRRATGADGRLLRRAG
jgi:L-cystine uptake protein TcyP (sodium:dicarboxylate symporter family)